MVDESTLHRREAERLLNEAKGLIDARKPLIGTVADEGAA